jgi:hypothetical protein
MNVQTETRPRLRHLPADARLSCVVKNPGNVNDIRIRAHKFSDQVY